MGTRRERNYRLDNHPLVTGVRKPDLNPYQKGLVVNRKSSIEKKIAGDLFEKRISNVLSNTISNAIQFDNVYFESGNYVKELCIYQSLQVDHIVVCDIGVICIEDKYIDGDKVKKISGGAFAKKWILTHSSGKKGYETNGIAQNYNHAAYLKQIFEVEGVDCPVFQLTVVSGLDKESILVEQLIDTNLVTENELMDRIEYLRRIHNNASFQKTDINKIANIINKWMCKNDGIEILHLFYCRNIMKKKIRLPKRCKNILRYYN